MRVSADLSAAVRADHVDVWQLELDRGRDGDLALLSGDERERAARFRYEVDRSRFVTGRAMLRRILACYVGCDPASVPLVYGEFGKPALAGSAGPFFNLSHSQDVGLLAISGREVGVDVEHPSGQVDDQVAERFFAGDEVEMLRSLPPGSRMRAFLSCWTRKEAYLKAKGGGLRFPLDRFAVSLVPGDEARMLWSELDRDTDRWSLVDLSDHVPPCVAALAVPGGSPTVQFHHYGGDIL